MEEFYYDNPKAIFDEEFVEVDIATWLSTETISSVSFTAVDSDGVDATATVLNVGASTYSGSVLQPFIKGGVNLERYTVVCQVTTSGGSKQEYRIKFRIKEAP